MKLYRSNFPVVYAIQWNGHNLGALELTLQDTPWLILYQRLPSRAYEIIVSTGLDLIFPQVGDYFVLFSNGEIDTFDKGFFESWYREDEEDFLIDY